MSQASSTGVDRLIYHRYSAVEISAGCTPTLTVAEYPQLSTGKKRPDGMFF